jgi:hypothetical protein
MPVSLLAVLLWIPMALGLLVTSPGDSDADGVPDGTDRCPALAGASEHLGCSQPVRLETKVTRAPRHRLVQVRDWRPWSAASPSQVHIILREEQERWGGPWLGNRVACESGFYWAALNGQYQGLLQFGPIWSSMWPGTPRGVRYESVRKLKLPVVRHTRWSSGRWTHRTIGRSVQRRRVVRTGRLPRNATPLHAWAAIRVGQRAVSGDGPTTAWSCGL